MLVCLSSSHHCLCQCQLSLPENADMCFGSWVYCLRTWPLPILAFKFKLQGSGQLAKSRRQVTASLQETGWSKPLWRPHLKKPSSHLADVCLLVWSLKHTLCTNSYLVTKLMMATHTISVIYATGLLWGQRRKAMYSIPPWFCWRKSGIYI